MKPNTRQLLVSISRSGGASGDIASDILYGTDTDIQSLSDAVGVTPSLAKVCQILHMPVPDDLEELARRVLPHIQDDGNDDDDYDDILAALKFDEDQAYTFHQTYLKEFDIDATSDQMAYLFASHKAFDKSPEENYGCAKALIDLFFTNQDPPLLLKQIVLMKGRVLDVY